jgi:hypothetical protein
MRRCPQPSYDECCREGPRRIGQQNRPRPHALKFGWRSSHWRQSWQASNSGRRTNARASNSSRKVTWVRRRRDGRRTRKPSCREWEKCRVTTRGARARSRRSRGTGRRRRKSGLSAASCQDQPRGNLAQAATDARRPLDTASLGESGTPSDYIPIHCRSCGAAGDGKVRSNQSGKRPSPWEPGPWVLSRRYIRARGAVAFLLFPLPKPSVKPNSVSRWPRAPFNLL